MNEIKVIIFCNNVIAIPVIREFIFYQKLVGVCVTKRNKEVQAALTPFLEDAKVPMFIIQKKEYEQQMIDAINECKPTVGILLTFPFLIPKSVFELKEKGFLNFHFGLLPQCRGPQPILRHMINNDEYTGVTVHIVDEGIDTGAIVCQEKLRIEEDDTYGTIQSKLAFLAAKLGVNVLKILSFGKIIPSVKQNTEEANYYDMPTAEELTINWKTMTAVQIKRLVNACNPWNKGAGTTIKEWMLGITAVDVMDGTTSNDIVAGTILECDNENGLIVKTIDSKKIRVNIIYTNEGFFVGHQISNFGVAKGDTFL